MGASECDGILVKTTVIATEKRTQRLSWLKLINQSNYSEAKSAAGGDYDDLFSANYDEFKVKRDELLLRESFDHTDEQARSLVQVGVPEAAIHHWGACMESRTEGLFSMVRAITDEEVLFKVIYRRSGDSKLKDRHERTSAGSSIEDSDFTRSPDQEFAGEARVRVKRDKNMDILFTVSGKSDGHHLSDDSYVRRNAPSPPKLRHTHNWGAAGSYSWSLPIAAHSRNVKVWFGCYHIAGGNNASCWAKFFVNGDQVYYQQQEGMPIGYRKSLGNVEGYSYYVPPFSTLKFAGETANDRATIENSVVVVHEV